jgi:hypothetical protein
VLESKQSLSLLRVVEIIEMTRAAEAKPFHYRQTHTISRLQAPMNLLLLKSRAS